MPSLPVRPQRRYSWTDPNWSHAVMPGYALQESGVDQAPSTLKKDEIQEAAYRLCVLHEFIKEE